MIIRKYILFFKKSELTLTYDNFFLKIKPVYDCTHLMNREATKVYRLVLINKEMQEALISNGLSSEAAEETGSQESSESENKQEE